MSATARSRNKFREAELLILRHIDLVSFFLFALAIIAFGAAQRVLKLVAFGHFRSFLDQEGH